jgi:hypothetical protein
MDLGIVLGIFIAWPILALVPSTVFTVMYLHCRRLPILLAALAWMAYFPYELAMKMRLLCSGECNIRVDLLLFYPLLLLLSILAAVAYLKVRRQTRNG